MPQLTIQPLRPSAAFADQQGNLTKEGYDFLYGLYRRVGGSLDSLNAVTLADKTWDSPDPIGVTTPSPGKFTTLQSTGAFGCNGSAVQVSYTLGATLGAYAAGANGLSTGAAMQALVNKVIAIETALKNNGICVT